MVGIVIVSHSEKLASGVLELAQQMVNTPLKIAIAAGVDDAENPLGTDVMRVLEAIESVYDEAGVAVLMDLGSAVMSAEMALEFLPEEKREKIRLCEAPLVEGAIAAVVQAAAGADIETVLKEARQAIQVKASQLSISGGDRNQARDRFTEKTFDEEKPFASEQKAQEIHLTVLNSLGIHARPAAKFVQLANRFDSHISVRNLTTDTDSVNAKSINQVATLGVRQGHEIAIAATGRDAPQALSALQELVENQFGTSESPDRSGETKAIASGTAESEVRGIPASPGIAIGPVVLYQPAIPDITEQQGDNPDDEWQQLQFALQTARRQIQAIAHKIPSSEEKAIFEAHKLYLTDPAVLEVVREQIFEKQRSAAAAWKAAIDRTVDAYEALEDPYLKARATDVRDVGRRVLRLLIDVRGMSLELPEAGIVVATDLTPSDVAQLDPAKVLGICTAAGGANTHSAILARSQGIPAVMGVGGQLWRLTNGTPIAIDGATGQVWIEPDALQIEELQIIERSQQTPDRVLEPTTTQDGRKILVMANILGVAGAQNALQAGAEGVGLLRTEFLYLDRSTPPTEDEQVEIYTAIAAVLDDRPLIIRTLDIGGDKPLPYLNLEPEANPFLGKRGIRLLLDYPDLLIPQLRAILRASPGHQIQVMFPTIASLGEVRAAKKMLAQAQNELREEGIPFDEAIAVGIMVEIPAAVAIADLLAAEVDFFSIGTNDLSQYAIAADRTNPQVASFADAFEPAVLRMIAQAIDAAHHAGISVGVCGELASSPLATPILVGLGVDALSMNPGAIATVKSAIVRLTIAEAEAIARSVLQLDSSETVKNYLSLTR